MIDRNKLTPSFVAYFERVCGHEGQLSLDEDDRGNWTGGQVGKGELRGSMYGISAAQYPELDIASLTRDECMAITYQDYYLKLGIDKFSKAMQYQMLDASYNHGMFNAIKIFQRAVNTVDDGLIGPNTMAAAKAMSEDDRLMRFNAYRLMFWADCKTFDKYGRGWVRRGAQNLLFAAEDNDN